MVPRCLRRAGWLCLLACLGPPPVSGKEPVRHWAFQPVVRPSVPAARNHSWVRNPIDAFIAVRHEAAKLTPAPEADRRVLVRRLSLDLVGLPPSPEEIETFLKDARPQAAEELVERLLTSPRHGERWARHWLDIARWAESEGYESNHLRPYSWRYRDYVVRSFNEDRPFDVFVRQQIAGDEMRPYSDENLIATGFLAACRVSSNEEDKWRQRNDMLVDVVNATSSAFLGLTLHCAQCHNHKLEPLPIRDYYRFMGFFARGQPGLFALRDERLNDAYRKACPPDYEKLLKRQQDLYESGRAWLTAEARKKLSPRQRRVLDVPEERRTAEEEALYRQADLLFQFTPERIERSIPEPGRKEYGELKKKIADIQKTLSDRPQTWAFYSPATSPTPVETLPMKGFYPLPYEPEKLARAFVLKGGDVHRRSDAVEPGWPAVLGRVPEGGVGDRPRLALADWLTSKGNPLTARVWANRVWQWHFGRGLVTTPSDFGLKGAPPSHPELLDWLAAELMDSGWSTRHLHRLIVSSATYRQASRPDRRNEAFDPENRLLWRWTPRRLEAETIRDSMLCVSGELDFCAGGPSDEDESKSQRRTLYLLQKRERPPAVQGLFDGPSAASESCPVRHTSTVPLQALYLLNNEFALRRAEGLARRVRELVGRDSERQTEVAFLLALGRRPEMNEQEATRRFLVTYRNTDAALVGLCQALLNLNEFVYLQ
jgi:hypothetical protein